MRQKSNRERGRRCEMDEQDIKDGTEMLFDELRSIVHRCAEESDISFAATIGVFECVKQEMLNKLFFEEVEFID